MKMPTKSGAKRSARRVPTKAAIRRAVAASSTAIETGQGLAQIERILIKRDSKFSHPKLVY